MHAAALLGIPYMPYIGGTSSIPVVDVVYGPRDLFGGSLDLEIHDLRTLENGLNSSILRYLWKCPVLPLLDSSDIPYDPRTTCPIMDGTDQYPPKGSKRTYFRGPSQDLLWVPTLAPYIRYPAGGVGTL